MSSRPCCSGPLSVTLLTEDWSTSVNAQLT
jgi:hypothetical protein